MPYFAWRRNVNRWEALCHILPEKSCIPNELVVPGSDIHRNRGRERNATGRYAQISSDCENSRSRGLRAESQFELNEVDPTFPSCCRVMFAVALFEVADVIAMVKEQLSQPLVLVRGLSDSVKIAGPVLFA